jgi:hypothetical protein
MNTTIRHYRAQDLGRVIRLWEARGPVSPGDGLTVDQAVDLINSEGTVTLVAEESGAESVGVAVGDVTHRATTEDFLMAIRGARPTVTEEMVEAFRADAEQYTRY